MYEERLKWSFGRRTVVKIDRRERLAPRRLDRRVPTRFAGHIRTLCLTTRLNSVPKRDPVEIGDDFDASILY